MFLSLPAFDGAKLAVVVKLVSVQAWNGVLQYQPPTFPIVRIGQVVIWSPYHVLFRNMAEEIWRNAPQSQPCQGLCHTDFLLWLVQYPLSLAKILERFSRCLPNWWITSVVVRLDWFPFMIQRWTGARIGRLSHFFEALVLDALLDHGTDRRHAILTLALDSSLKL